MRGPAIATYENVVYLVGGSVDLYHWNSGEIIWQDASVFKRKMWVVLQLVQLTSAKTSLSIAKKENGFLCFQLHCLYTGQ